MVVMPGYSKTVAVIAQAGQCKECKTYVTLDSQHDISKILKSIAPNPNTRLFIEVRPPNLIHSFLLLGFGVKVVSHATFPEELLPALCDIAIDSLCDKKA